MIFLISLNFILPLIAAISSFIRNDLTKKIVINLAGLLLVINNIYIWRNYSGESTSLVLLNILDGYQLAFTIEPLAIIFALMVSILYCATNLYSFCYLKAQEYSKSIKDLKANIHFLFMPVAIMASLAIGYSANLITLFIFYEVLTFSTYPLVIQSLSDRARRAGRLYITMLFCSSSVFLLFALVFLDKYYNGSSFVSGGIFNNQTVIKDILILMICFVFGFSKTAIFPLYKWLPEAMVAPVPVSALLHAVAVVKSGIFALIKVFVYLFGIDYLAYVHQISPWTINWLSLLACFTIIFATIKACSQDGLKRILAYSTINQLSYIILVLSFVSQASVIAAILQMLAHSIAKITLFFSVGIIYVSLHSAKVSEMQGIFRKLPIPVILFILSALSILGLPFSIGYLTIGNLYKAIALNNLGIVAIACLFSSSILSCYYFTKTIFQMLQLPSEEPIHLYYRRYSCLTLITTATLSLSLLLAFYLNDLIAIISTVFNKNIFTY